MNSGKLKFLFIVLVFAVPFIYSYILINENNSGKKLPTSNYGKFVDPIVSINNILYLDFFNNKINSNSLNGKWTLIYYISKYCDSVCLNNIYLLRQINTAVGKDMNRVQRVLLIDTSYDSNEIVSIKKKYPDLLVIKKRLNKLHNVIKTIKDYDTDIFIVDPIGNVILKYKKDFNGKKFLKDLKKLLKLSKIG